LLIGVNDQYQNGEPEEYRIKFKEALEIAIQYAGGVPDNVIVVSIPDWEVTPFADQSIRPFNEYSIDRFNEINLQEAQNYGARYVSITPVSRLVVTDESLLADDGLHPSGEMYALWVKEMLPQVLEVIEK
jgi:lysophospholipase L1-like esterase